MPKPDLAVVGKWVAETCLLFGAEPHIAYLVAGEFTEGLAKEWEKQDKAGEAPEKKEGEDG